MTDIAKALEKIEEANSAETGALALQPAEDAAQILAENVDEGEEGYAEAGLAVLDVWERRDLYQETVARAERAARVQRGMARILKVTASRGKLPQAAK
jgi:hypothetical protein